MNFTDFGFWPRLFGCLAITLFIRWLLFSRAGRDSGNYDKLALAATSLYLLSCVDALTFWIFLLLSLLCYIGILAVSRIPQDRRRIFLAVYIPILLTPLVYYKYRTFILEEIIGWESLTFSSLAIPAGISFYTFQKVAILVDVARLPAYRPKFLDFLNFVSFFPQIVAGPIERKSDLMPQVERFRLDLCLANLNLAAPWLALGFFYKICIADNLTSFIDRNAMESAWPIVLCTIFFGFKIYFDFCGYSLIALGIARALGVQLTLNFRSPYLSTNIREFWRRWHVSLSYWFRDYIYIPLGGSQTSRWAVNLLIVFVISGLWHGAAWNFLLWGLLHGVYCVCGHVFKSRLNFPKLVGWAFTMLLVFIAWLPFYETRWDVLMNKTQILASPASWNLHALSAYMVSLDPKYIATGASVVALCCIAFAMEILSLKFKSREFYMFVDHPIIIAILVALTVFFGAVESNEFIYFSF